MSIPVASALPVGRSMLYLVVAGIAWGTMRQPRP